MGVGRGMSKSMGVDVGVVCVGVWWGVGVATGEDHLYGARIAVDPKQQRTFPLLPVHRHGSPLIQSLDSIRINTCNVSSHRVTPLIHTSECIF